MGELKKMFDKEINFHKLVFEWDHWMKTYEEQKTPTLKGSFARAYRVEKDGEDFTLKQVLYSPDEKNASQVYSEIMGFNRLQKESNSGKYFPKFLEYLWDEENKFCILMEHIELGSLGRVLEKEKTLTESQARMVIKQVATALQECLKFQCCHRDISDSTVLVRKWSDEEVKVLLCDFNFAKMEVEQASFEKYPTCYQAPELFPPNTDDEAESTKDGQVKNTQRMSKKIIKQFKKKFFTCAPKNEKSVEKIIDFSKLDEHEYQLDVYSLGILAYHLLSGGYHPYEYSRIVREAKPFWREDPQKNPDVTKISYYGSKKLWDSISKAGKEFIEYTVRYNSGERPSYEEILQHRWLTSSDGEDQMKKITYKDQAKKKSKSEATEPQKHHGL